MYDLLCDDKSKYLKNEYKLFDVIIPFNILSAAYMLIDIFTMLFLENYFPWIDLKFNKRLDRIFKLYIMVDNINNSLQLSNKQNQIQIFIELINIIKLNIDNCPNIIECLSNEYQKIKNNIIIINIENNFKYLHINNNNELTDKYLLFIYDNIYETIVNLLYIYNNEILTTIHYNYCYSTFEKIILCDKLNKCENFQFDAYSYDDLIKTNHIELFKEYIDKLLININNNKKYLQKYNSDDYKYAIENIY